MLTRRFIGFALVVLALFTVLVVGYQAYRAKPSSTVRQKLAEGVYSMESAPDHAKIDVDSFTLWSAPSQHLMAEIDMPAPGIRARDETKPHRQTEKLEMNADFTMRRLRYELENTTISGDGALDCSASYSSLDCESTFGGNSGKGSIAVGSGYAAQFGVEVALLDFPWFFTTLVAHGNGRTRHAAALKAVGISFDGQTPETVVTGRSTEVNLSYAGMETISVLGHSVKAHRFQVSGGRSRDIPDLTSSVWVSERGLLLAADWGDERIELRSLLQWEKLVGELPVEDERTNAIRRSGQFQGQQYMRVQGAIWVDIASPEEAEYEKLSSLGLAIVSEPSRERVQGKRFLIVKLTDAGKAAAVKWKDGTSDWDIPIARERIVEIQAEQQWEKPAPSVAYIVNYRWEPTSIGNQIKGDLPAAWAISTETITAKAYLKYVGNEWKVMTVQRPGYEGLKRRSSQPD